jgi:hypothetical protein
MGRTSSKSSSPMPIMIILIGSCDAAQMDRIVSCMPQRPHHHRHHSKAEQHTIANTSVINVITLHLSSDSSVEDICTTRREGRGYDGDGEK